MLPKIVLFSMVISAALVFASFDASADVVYLENGGSVEGVITKEGDTSVEMDLGFGSVVFWKGEIKKITRSNSRELYGIKKEWNAKKKELRKKEKEFYEAREKRFREYAKWTEEERTKKLKSSGEPSEIKVSRDVNSRSILVDALLDDKVKATLVLDTGASLVVLSNKIGQELGLDLNDTNKGVVTLRMAGNRTANATLVTLKSINVQGIEVKDVMAAVLIEEGQDIGFKDGLLGMTFLNKFNLKIDLKNMKVVLEKINQ